MAFPPNLALPHIQKLHPYTPGLQPTGPGWVKLNTNECPYPPSPRVAAAIEDELREGGSFLRLYPNPTSAPLRRTVAKLHGVTEEHVCIGNGSDDILNLLVRVFASNVEGVGMTLPSYSLYPVLVAIQDGSMRTIPFDRSMKLPLEQIVASKARIFFLTSPNAPTGVAFPVAEIEELLNRMEGILVVDEAYAPFAKEDAVRLLGGHPNLVIVRTLSKAYALAGIRVGYALAHPSVIDLLDRVRDSYNVNRLSQVAAEAALNDQDYYSLIIDRVRQTRDHYAREWGQRWGWYVYPSEANFLFLEPKAAQGNSGPEVARAAYDFLVSRKVLVRYFPSHALTASFLRITVGTDDEMLVVNESLEAWRTNA